MSLYPYKAKATARVRLFSVMALDLSYGSINSTKLRLVASLPSTKMISCRYLDRRTMTVIGCVET